ncbi:MAG TPA: alpha-amylase family glycosyl hydrolase [Candidatus Limnocylindrales bacterium]|nr:alpha-amylase family glycosyl hydrolase [Candidatus Limnocylindrales bacterium]
MRRVTARTSWIAALVLCVSACSPAAPTPAPPGPSASAAPTPAAPSVATSPTVAPGSACTPLDDPAAKDWNSRTWYEVFVRSFSDSDGDGIGDLRGLTAKLDYLNDGDPATTTDLGVGGLWLMPVAESPSYHGYDVVDYRAIERDYGTTEDMKAFLAAAHERGIEVIVDLVMNHSSSEHPWFKDAATPGSKHDDWYVWADEKPTWLGPSGQVVWHGEGKRWFYGVFWEGMPDLNLRNAEVTAELEDIARYWLEDLGVDGFRLDAAKHFVEDGKDAQVNTPETKAWLAGFRASVDAVKPDALLIGEVYDPAKIAGPYVPDSLDMTFNFSLATGIRLALQNGRVAPLATALGDTIASWPANQQGSFLTNHDQTRIMNELYGDVASARLAAFLLLTAPGTPFVYYGEEIGMTGKKPDERIRTPMRWTADPATAGFTAGSPWQALSEDDPASVNVEAQLADPESLLATYHGLIRTRAANPALQAGLTLPVDGGAEPVIGWLRTTSGQVLLSVVNVSDAPVTDYGLTLDVGPLCGAVTARLVASVGAGGPGADPVAPTAPVVTAEGGLDAYAPLPVLPPRSGYLIALEPAP